jgi:hypothetical protein
MEDRYYVSMRQRDDFDDFGLAPQPAVPIAATPSIEQLKVS